MPRRRFLLGLGAALAAPAIVPYSSLMPVRAERFTPVLYLRVSIRDLSTPALRFVWFGVNDLTPWDAHERALDDLNWLTLNLEKNELVELPSRATPVNLLERS